MKLAWDRTKREQTLAERGLDFAETTLVFAGPTLEFQDSRKEYGETRMVCVGFLRGRMVVLVYTDRSGTRHIISMRKANEREKKIYKDRLG